MITFRGAHFKVAGDGDSGKESPVGNWGFRGNPNRNFGYPEFSEVLGTTGRFGHNFPF